MKKLGTVKNVIHDGTILLKGEETPAPGVKVFDSRGAEVGGVTRIFGPADRPYVSVRPGTDTDAIGLLGAPLYYDPERRVEDRARTGKRTARGRSRAPGSGKKGVNKWRRKEKPRKK